MSDRIHQTLNHFTCVRFTDSFWAEPADERERIRTTWLDGVRASADAVHVYQSFGPEADTDLLLWCACDDASADRPRSFFTAFARAAAPTRRYLTVTATLWGFTRPSQYTKKRSEQEINPFNRARAPYLIVYPFVKSADWYMKDQPERQALMLEHIKVGKQYKDITQLLLYSFGLQDQEFVVVYETSDLSRFLSLVTELRSTEARLYTARDTPLHSGIYQPDDAALAAWL